MYRFVGNFQHTLDSKGRMFLPVKHREQFGEDKKTVVITRGMYDCLMVMPGIRVGQVLGGSFGTTFFRGVDDHGVFCRKRHLFGYRRAGENNYPRQIFARKRDLIKKCLSSDLEKFLVFGIPRDGKREIQ